MDLNSIVIYIITFMGSFFFLKLGENHLFVITSAKNTCKPVRDIRSRKFLYLLYTVIGLSIPCFLAALRAESVGTDIKGYVIPNYQMVSGSNITIFHFLDKSVNNIEPLFAIILYFCARIKSLKLFFFIIQMLVIVPLYLSLLKYKDISMPSFGMLMYYFLFYNFSLSGMRQSIAMSFVLLGWSNIENKNIKKTLVLFLIAFLFHRSAAAIEFLIIFIIVILQIGKKHKKITYLTIGGLLVFTFFFYQKFALQLSEIVNLISGHYVSYINMYLNSKLNFQEIFLTDILFKSLVLIIALLAIYFSKKKLSLCFIQIIWFSILGRYFILFMAVFYEASRIAYYFDYFLIVLVSIIVKECFRQNLKNLIIVQTLMLIPIVTYWIYFIMYIGAYGTNIFKFA